ncbi:hypothetical protein [Parafrankia sp. EUN1f]|uniref:hypothetical protein n=1 Tax=Parafrankia sp. EUN1f TaxID=102897 RepID=UPI0007C4E36F|nr:hypothetical protein [Parafrankia sp. EUN1f]
MTFESWLARLRDRGFVTCPGSSAVPIDLKAVTADGTGLHFRCRGVRVHLDVYRPGRAAWQTPLRDEAWSPEETLELWENRPVQDRTVPTGGRLVFVGPGPDSGPSRGGGSGGGEPGSGRDGDGPEPRPDTRIVLDGARSRGWRGHEAGLLAAAEAAAIFESMLVLAGLVTATGHQPPAPRLVPAQGHTPRQPRPARAVQPAEPAMAFTERTYSVLATARATGVDQPGLAATGTPPSEAHSPDETTTGGGAHPLSSRVL